MTEQRREYVARRVIEQQLVEVQFDEHGTPDRKLPDCPLCGEDELYGWRNGSDRRGFRCYRCSYRLDIEEHRSSTPPPPRVIRIDLAELERSLDAQHARDMVLSALINRAGGTIVLTEDELQRDHGPKPTVSFDAKLSTYTLTTVPCPKCASGRAGVAQA